MLAYQSDDRGRLLSDELPSKERKGYQISVIRMYIQMDLE